MRDGTWKCAGEICTGDHIMPFFRYPVNQYLTDFPTKQYPRIFTFSHGWIHERHFVDSWRTGKIDKKMLKNQDLSMNFMPEVILSKENLLLIKY